MKKSKTNKNPDAPVADGRLFREAKLVMETRENANGEKVTVVRASISSETPYLRSGIWDKEVKAFVAGYEVLGHAEGEIDTSRMKDGLVIQDKHWGDQIGIIREPEIADGKISGVIEFGCGERAQEIARDAAAGIRRNMSVGYFVRELTKTGKAEDGYPIFRVTKWTPYEASFVNVPADTGVGVGRSQEETGAAVEMPAAVETRKEQAMTPEQIAALVAKAERANIKATEVTSMVTAGKSYEEICDMIAERACARVEEIAAKSTPTAPKAARAIFDEGETKTIEKKYNLLAVVRSMVAAHEGKTTNEDIAFEREISDEIAKQTRREAKGFFIPEAVFCRAFDKATAAAALVGKDTLFGNAIEALVAETVLGKAGVTTLSGLVGDIAIPKLGAASGYWITAEGGDATASTPNVGQVAGTPHTVGAYTDITRKLLLQSGISAQGFIADALRSALARAIETAVFSGTGKNGQPTGLVAVTGVQSVSMTAGAPTKANLVEFWSKLYASNVNGSKCFIGSPAVKGLLASTLDIKEGSKSNVAGAHYLCENDKVEGYDFLMSNLCGAGKLYFGDWSNIVLAFWSGLDLTVDTASLSKSGGVRLVALQDCDVLVRHPEAFAVGTAIAAS
jgi:HK97 family phage major capsid protein